MEVWTLKPDRIRSHPSSVPSSLQGLVPLTEVAVSPSFLTCKTRRLMLVPGVPIRF